MTTQLPTPAPLPVSAPEEPPATGRPLLAVIAAAILAIGFLGAITALVVWLADRQNIGPEVALSLQFVAAAVLLILVICILVIVFQRLGLVDKSRAMGLPDGSIRAIIALLLIVLFFLAAIFLFEATQNKPDESVRRSLQGITSDRLAGIPTDQILSLQTRTEADTTVYDVELAQAPTNTPVSTDIAKQLVTVIGTLVTAVAAFYFGANSVSAAASRASRETSQALGAQAASGGGPTNSGGAPPDGSSPVVPGAGPPDAGAGDPGTGEVVSGEDAAAAPTPGGPDDAVAGEAAAATDGDVAPLDVNDPSVGDLEAEPAPEALPDAPYVDDSEYDPANNAIDPDTQGETDDPDTPGASGPPPDPSAGGEDI